jgi:hypothetical protein
MVFNCGKKYTKSENMKTLQAYCFEQDLIPKPLIFVTR